MSKKGNINLSEPSTPNKDPDIERQGTMARGVDPQELHMLVMNGANHTKLDSVKEMEYLLKQQIDNLEKNGFTIFENEFSKQIKDYKQVHFMNLPKRQQQSLNNKFTNTQGLNNLNSSVLSQYIVQTKIKQELKSVQSIQQWIDSLYEPLESDQRTGNISMSYAQLEALRKDCEVYIEKYCNGVMKVLKQKLIKIKMEVHRAKIVRQGTQKGGMILDYDSEFLSSEGGCLRSNSKIDAKQKNDHGHGGDQKNSHDKHVHDKKCTTEYYNPKKVLESQNRPIYEKIQGQLMDFPSTEILPNKVTNYRKCIYNQLNPKTKKIKSACRGNQMCSYEKMAPDPTLDQTSIMTIPFPSSPRTGYNSKKINQDFANADFLDRNLALKQPHLRVIATEESLDEWQGQSMGVTGEKVYRTRRALFQNPQFANIGSQSIMTKKQVPLKQKNNNKTTEPTQLELDDLEKSRDDSGSVKDEKTASPGTAAEKKNLEAQYAQYHEEYKKVIEQSKPPNYINAIREYEDMKPTVYSVYQHQKSFLIDGRKHKSPMDVSDDSFKIRKSQDQKGKGHMLQETNFKNRQMMNEIGGFSQKQIKDQYFEVYNKINNKIKDQKREEKVQEEQRRHDSKYINRSIKLRNDLASFQQQKSLIQKLMKQNQERGKSTKSDLSNVKKANEQNNRTRNIPVFSKTKASISIKMYPQRNQSASVMNKIKNSLGNGSNQSMTRSYFDMHSRNQKFQNTFSQHRNSSNIILKQNIKGNSRPFMGGQSLKVIKQEQAHLDFYNTQYTIHHDTAALSKKKDKNHNATIDQVYYGTSPSVPNLLTKQASAGNLRKNQSKWPDQMKIMDTDSDYPGSRQGDRVLNKGEASSSRQGSTRLTQCSFNSLSEKQFFELNSSLKGHNVTDNKKNRVLMASQSVVFNTQKRNVIKSLMQTHNEGMRIQKNSSAHLDCVHAVKQQENQKAAQSPFKEPELPAAHAEYDEEKWKVFVKKLLAEIDRDNQEDLDRPTSTIQEERCGQVDQANSLRTSLVPKDFPPQARLRNRKLDFQDGDFWFLKGYDHAHSGREEELDSAIDSYRHAIRLDHTHPSQVNLEEDDDCLHMCVHNLACAYSQQQRYDSAIKWFKLAIGIDPQCPQAVESYYGYALCQFKSGRPRLAIEYLDEAIKMGNDGLVHDALGRVNHHRRKNSHYRYFRALCHKVCGNHAEAERDYTNILKQFELQEGKQVSKHLFAMLVLPLEQSRKILLQFVDTFKGIIDKYEVPNIDRRQISQHHLKYIDKSKVYINENDDPYWFDKKIPEVIETLQRLSFFKRFGAKRLREMMNKMEVTVIKDQKLLFPDAQKVYVIISGSILMQSHKQRYDLPVTFAKFTEGDIINHLQAQCTHYQSIETWFFAQVETEIAIFDKSYFKMVWETDLMTEQLRLHKSIIKCQTIFQDLSELALTSLVSEFMDKQTFSKGAVIKKQSKYSPANTQYRIFYKEHAVKFIDRMKDWKNKTHNQSCRGKKPDQQREKSKCCAKQNVQGDPEAVTMTTVTATQVSHVQSAPNELDEDNVNLQQQQNLSGHQEITKDLVKRDRGERRKGLNPHTREFQEHDIWVNEDPNFDQTSQGAEEQEGMYFIISGKAQIINTQDDYEAKTLKKGDYFGESEIIRVIGFDFFGDVVAESETVECLFISKQNFQKIALFEQMNIKQHALKREVIHMLAYEYSRRYQIDLSEFDSFYG